MSSIFESARGGSGGAELPARPVLFGEILFDEFPDRSVLGGAPFNVSRHLRGLGLDPIFITRVGEDEAGSEAQTAVTRFRVDTLGVQHDHVRPTGRVRVEIVDGEPKFEIVENQAYDHIDAGVVHALARAINPAIVYFGTLAQRGAESRRALESLLRIASCPLFLDINLRAPWYDRETVERSLGHATIVKMNRDELRLLGRMLETGEDDDPAIAARLLETYRIERLIITCGKEGAWARTASGDQFHAKDHTEPVDVVDTVGAGDGFAAVSILGHLLEWPVAETLTRADAFARAVCRIRGAVPYEEAFYLPFLESWGIVSN